MTSYPLWKVARNARWFWAFLLLIVSIALCSSQPFTLLDPNLPPEIPRVTPPPGTHNIVSWWSVFNYVTNHLGTSPPGSFGSDPAPPNNTSDVFAWGDIQGQGNVLTNSNVNHIAPYYKSSGGASNNCPYIYTDWGTAYALHCALGGTARAQPSTFYFVASIEVNSANDGIFFNANADQNMQMSMSHTPATMNIEFGVNQAFPSATYFNANTIYPAWAVWTIQANGASSLLRTNGVVVASGLNMGALAQTGLTLFNVFNNGQSAHVLLTEVIWDNFGASSSDMLLVEEYLGRKYGIHVQ